MNLQTEITRIGLNMTAMNTPFNMNMNPYSICRINLFEEAEKLIQIVW